MTVTYRVATLGRPTLRATLESLVRQRLDGDQILVIGATPDIQRTAAAYGCQFVYCEPGNDWGSTERNVAVSEATGDYLAFIDDDDVVTPGSRRAIEEAMAAHRGRPLIFRMEYGDTGGVLWSAKVLCMGNVGTPMFVLPNDRSKLGTWGKEYGGDFQFIQTSRWAPDDYVWIPDIIAKIRPY